MHVKQHQTTAHNSMQSSQTSYQPSYSFISSIPTLIPSPPPPPAPLILPPQTPPNPHLTQPLQHQQTGPTSGTDVRWLATSCGKPAQNLPAYSGRLVRLQSRPWVVPRARFGHICVTCDTQSQYIPSSPTVPAMGSHGTDAGWGLGGWGYLEESVNGVEWILVGLWAPGAARAAARMAIRWL